MRIVIATSLVPAGTPESGYEIATAAITDAFERAGAQIVHLGFTWPDRDPSEPESTVLLGRVNVKTADAGLKQKLSWLTQAIAAGIPFVAAKLRIVGMTAVRYALARIDPDVVVINGTAMVGAFEKELTARPFIFIAHNVEHESAREAARDAGDVLQSLLYRREARLLQGLEERLIAGARHVLTLTDEDRRAFALEGSARASVAPLVTPPMEAAVGTRVPAFDIGLIGTWTWAPNRVGLEWFLQQVMPLLPAQATVAVAGTTPPGFPKRDERVRFLGRVIDAKQFQRQCRVMALTARAGTGVQLKTIEALELGLPAVATPASMRGIVARPDNLRIAETPQAFAEALAALIVEHRTGKALDADGADFRSGQLAGLDRAIAEALSAFKPDTSNQSDPMT